MSNEKAPPHAVSLRCRSSTHGVLFDGRYLRLRCDGTFCSKPGHVTWHVFDLVTREQRTEYEAKKETDDGDVRTDRPRSQ